jgi:hypothetical protein
VRGRGAPARSHSSSKGDAAHRGRHPRRCRSPGVSPCGGGSAIEHAKPGTTKLRTLAAYVEALGGRLEIIADFGDQRLAFTEPGTDAA